MYLLPNIQKADTIGKRVFLRADTDVPLTPNGQIEDDTRLNAWWPTLQYLLDHNATVIIGGKLGRPVGIDTRLSLEPVAKWIGEIIKIKDLRLRNERIGELNGWKISDNLFLLENLQFYKEERENNGDFAKQLANLATIFVNDAFAVCHRNNASVVGVAALLPHFAGLQLQKEIEVLGSVLENPKRPLVVIIGGAKIETKLPLVQKMLGHADFVLVGGKLLMEGEELRKLTSEKLVLAKLLADGADVTEESIVTFRTYIQQAGTIVWNGPFGVIDPSCETDTERGTREIAEVIAKSSAYKIVGGGDTLDFLKKIGLFSQFDFCSTGGGAMLAFLSGEKLPGIEALLA
jgi:phosphoglycerate kinase